MTTYAVIQLGGSQHIVSKGDVLSLPIDTNEKTITLEAMAVFDDKNTTLGNPVVAGSKVKLSVGDEFRGEKVTSIKFQAKKRVKTIHGHRQSLRKATVSEISG